MRRFIDRVCKYSKVFGLTTAGTVAVIGVILYERSRKYPLYSEWAQSPEAKGKWDYNWDKREPDSLVKPLKEIATDDEKEKHKEKLEGKVPHVTRHLLLIRHGQYHDKEMLDINRTLTELGKEQAHLTGQRLADMSYPYSKLISSTMTRAKETANIIHKYLPDLPREECDLLREGAPIRPDPPSAHWRPDSSQFHKDGARIEAAFRKYFHRANPDQANDSYEIVVCHANVIRYFVCRALQFPPEGWLRISLNHASVTWIYIRPNGRVGLRVLGEAGFMPVDKFSRQTIGTAFIGTGNLGGEQKDLRTDTHSGLALPMYR